jgi:hypothetical protein
MKALRVPVESPATRQLPVEQQTCACWRNDSGRLAGDDFRVLSAPPFRGELECPELKLGHAILPVQCPPCQSGSAL